MSLGWYGSSARKRTSMRQRQISGLETSPWPDRSAACPVVIYPCVAFAPELTIGYRAANDRHCFLVQCQKPLNNRLRDV